MTGHLPTEFYMNPRPGDAGAVERMCALATNRPCEDVVAVAVAPANVGQAADLLFGTGVGVVSAIDDLSIDWIDQARRSVAQGATEIALPPMVLHHETMLTRLRSRLGPVTPVTVGVPFTFEGLDVAAAELALRLGADYVSFLPSADLQTARRDIAALLALAHHLELGGVKIAVNGPCDAAFLHSETSQTMPWAARLCLPISSAAA